MNHSDVSIKNQILTELFSSSKLSDMLKKHDAGAGQQDLKSELFLVLCSQPEEKIKQLSDSNQLMFFATGIVQRMIFQKNSKFHRTYRKTDTEYNDSIDVPCETYDLEKDKKESELSDKLDSLHWVESAMLGIYVKEGSLLKACKKTGISYKNATTIIKQARKKLGTSLNGKLMGSYLVANVEMVLDVTSEVNPESVLELMDEFQDFLNYKLSGQTLPSKTKQDAFIKEIKPAKIKKII